MTARSIFGSPQSCGYPLLKCTILHDICEHSVDIVYENVDDEDNMQDFAGQKDIHRWITFLFAIGLMRQHSFRCLV